MQVISTSEGYQIERLRPEHYPLLQKLFGNAFNITITLSEIEKRFDTVSLGMGVIGFIAIHKQSGEPAAYYGVFPMKAIIKNEIVQIAQSGDTMTHSAHRKKGLFVKLALLTYEECKRKGIKLLIGQPNEYSYHGLVNKLGWTKLDEIVRWDLKQTIKTVPLIKIANRLSFLNRIYSSFIKFILRKHIVWGVTSFNNTLPSAYGKILRDEKYLEYKKSADKFFIKINNLSLWIRLTDIFWIGDFDNYESITPAVIKKIKKLAYLLGYNTISFNMNRSLPFPDSLKVFSEYSSQASCFLYFDKAYHNQNILLTAADSDDW